MPRRRRGHAIITSPRANASTTRTRERRSVPRRRRRKTRTPTAARQKALIVRSDTRSVSSAASSLAVISKRLCGPKKPNVMRVTCKTIAASVRARDQDTLEPVTEVSRGEREEHVHEKDRWKEIERLAEGEREIVRRPRKRRDEVRESRRDHQGAKPAVRPSPPREEAAQDVGHRQPFREQRDDEGLAERGPHQRIAQRRDKRVRRRAATDDGDRPQREQARRRTRGARFDLKPGWDRDGRAGYLRSVGVPRTYS